MLQLADDVGGRLPPIVGVLDEAAAHDLGERGRHLRLKHGCGQWLMFEDGFAHTGRVVALECSRPGQHFVDHRAEREQIASGVELLPQDLFRRHITERPENRPISGHVHIVGPGRRGSVGFARARGAAGCDLGLRKTEIRVPAQFREPEIEQLHAARREHDVRGLQIPVHDAVAMRVVERAGDLHRIRKCLVHRHSPGRQSGGECFAAEILHHEEIDLVLTPDVVQRADVWVGECGHRPGFAREPRAHRRIYRDAARQHLDRNKAVETGIGGAEDLTHATRAEQSLDAVRAKGRAADQVQTFIEDGCRSRPHRVIQDDARIVLTQQRRDLVAERFIARAGLGEKRVARGRVLLDGQLVDSGDGLPALGSHVHADLLAIGKGCTRRVVRDGSVLRRRN